MKFEYIKWAVIAILAGLVVYLWGTKSNYRDLYNTAASNNKAYQEQIEGLNESNKAFQFTIDQLEQLNDASVKSLDSMRKELKIKDRKILQMQKTKEYVYIHDSVKVIDTFVKEPDFVFDTCLQDRWHKNCIYIAYPNEIGMSTEVYLEQDCFLYKKRETVNPPKKTWLGRLFQKKHDVYQVILYEHNPYSTVKENKFIKILDNE
jgi:hypothetical protein